MDRTAAMVTVEVRAGTRSTVSPAVGRRPLSQTPGSADRVLLNNGPRPAATRTPAGGDPVNERGGGMNPGPGMGEPALQSSWGGRGLNTGVSAACRASQDQDPNLSDGRLYEPGGDGPGRGPGTLPPEAAQNCPRLGRPRNDRDSTTRRVRGDVRCTLRPYQRPV